uniref:RING-type E3 ubiquitin transferase n=1 Tax=Cercocebus atys TaxID=9531 RepID=A0A2K5MMQ0_CERAT
VAEHFKQIIRCPVCLKDLEEPMQLKCGYVCCLQCLNALQKEPDGEGLLCHFCSVVSQKNDIKPKYKLRAQVSIIKELEPKLKSILTTNPKIRKFQVDMTLDVDTANNYLIISEDLRSFRSRDFSQNRKEQAERFHIALCVLGAPCFTFGRHYWEVDVGTSEVWDVGICKESVNRQGKIVLSSEHGFLTVGCGKGKVFALHRVGIFPDVGMRSISFYNVSDGCHIYTFNKISVSEPWRPIFAHKRGTQEDQTFLSICSVINPASASAPIYSGESE